MNTQQKPDANQPDSAVPLPTRKPEQIDPAPAAPATAQQLTEVGKQMSGFEKATLRWARAAVIMSGLAAAFVCLQWWEMHTGGKDTHDLAVAAGNQATWTQNLAANMQTQADRTKDLADRMKDQADRTRDLANETKTIADQAIVQANAARSAGETAKETLQVSQQAYLTLGPPVDDFQNGRINIPVANGGHIPSGHVKVVEHEMTARLDDPNEPIIPLDALLETHWREVSFRSIPVVLNGTLFNVEVHTPKVVEADIKSGKQSIQILLVMTYNNGFPDMPDQTWLFCDASTYRMDTKLFLMRPCDDPNAVLQTLMRVDHYPDPNYQEQ